MPEDVMQCWYKFVSDCNKDSGYASSYTAGLERSNLEAMWREKCPGLNLPAVLWSEDSGCYELTGFNVPK